MVRGLEGRGLVVKNLNLVGSVASGYARADSDIDLEMAVEGMAFDQLSGEYFAKQIEISDMVIEILGPKNGDLYEKFKAIDVHLENSYENPEFRKVREGRVVNNREGQYENKAELR